MKDGKARCTCNGEVLEEEFRVPPKGPIGLEGDRGQLEYRRIRIGKDDGNLLNATNSVCSWTFETSGDGAGEIATQGDAIVFTTSRTDDTDWHVQAYQPGLSLREGGRYRVSFDLKSPQSATVVLLAMINVDDYHTIGVAEEIYAEPTYQTHQLEFTATDVKEGQNRIGFVLGRDKGTVFVRNFRLVAVD